MNQITKIIKEREGKFDEEFLDSDRTIHMGGSRIDDLKSHNKATILAILEALEEEITKLHDKMAEDYSDAEYRSNYMSEALSLITLTKQEIK